MKAWPLRDIENLRRYLVWSVRERFVTGERYGLHDSRSQALMIAAKGSRELREGVSQIGYSQEPGGGVSVRRPGINRHASRSGKHIDGTVLLSSKGDKHVLKLTNRFIVRRKTGSGQ